MNIRSIAGGLVTGLIVVFSSIASADDADKGSTSTVTGPRSIILPMIDPDRGRRLFVAQGCFLCHAINGAGGIAAPALDAPYDIDQLDLMGFVARMWQGASAMLELQALELGYQIELSSDEIADLAAFASSPQAQQDFSMEEIPETLRDWIVQKPYWQGDGWPENFEQEYNENGLPLDYR
ncbi:MAG: c-type cytochrome [Geminicoccaceae bacterium]